MRDWVILVDIQIFIDELVVVLVPFFRCHVLLDDFDGLFTRGEHSKNKIDDSFVSRGGLPLRGPVCDADLQKSTPLQEHAG